jgi:hypothetical protein
MPQPMKRSARTLWVPLSIFLLVGLLWALTPYLISRMGQFGDQFGSVNALFSGLTFAGILVVLWRHRDEYATQQTSIKTQMKLLSDVIAAQTEASSSATQAARGQAFAFAAGIIQSDRVRMARRLVFKLLRDKDFTLWSPAEQAQAEIVCHSFDQIGIMIKNGMVKPQTLIDGWYASIVESWKILEPFIRSRRKEFGAENLGAGFRYLFDEVKKIKKAEAERLANYQSYPIPGR